MEWLFVKTLLSLAAVLGLMFVLVYFMRKFMLGGRARTAARVDIEILGQKGLHPKRSVVVLRVLGKVMVVGMSEAGLQNLGEIDDPDTLAELDAHDAPHESGSLTNRWMTWTGGNGSEGSFAGQLSKYFGAHGVEKHEKTPRRGRKSAEGR